MEIKTYTNKRTEPNDFTMNHKCNYYSFFNAVLINIPDTDILICKNCLTNLIKEIDKEILK